MLSAALTPPYEQGTCECFGRLFKRLVRLLQSSERYYQSGAAFYRLKISDY